MGDNTETKADMKNKAGKGGKCMLNSWYKMHVSPLFLLKIVKKYLYSSLIVFVIITQFCALYPKMCAGPGNSNIHSQLSVDFPWFNS